MAERVVDDASRAIDAESERLSIPSIFRPSIHLGWRSQGENAIAARVRDPRRVAKAEIACIEEKAKVAHRACPFAGPSEARRTWIALVLSQEIPRFAAHR
jgi:hypothetical protein